MDVRTKRVIEIWGTIAGILVLGLWFAYCSASSSYNVPKADKYAQEANTLERQSVQSESNANTIRDSRIQNDVDTAKSKNELNKRKSHYETQRNTPVRVDNSNLNARERNLLANLNTLYNSNR